VFCKSGICKKWKMGVFFVKKWTFPQRRVHYVQYQYFFYFTFYFLGVRTPTGRPLPTGLGWGRMYEEGQMSDHITKHNTSVLSRGCRSVDRHVQLSTSVACVTKLLPVPVSRRRCCRRPAVGSNLITSRVLRSLQIPATHDCVVIRRI